MKYVFNSFLVVLVALFSFGCASFNLSGRSPAHIADPDPAFGDEYISKLRNSLEALGKQRYLIAEDSAPTNRASFFVVYSTQNKRVRVLPYRATNGAVSVRQIHDQLSPGTVLSDTINGIASVYADEIKSGEVELRLDFSGDRTEIEVSLNSVDVAEFKYEENTYHLKYALGFLEPDKKVSSSELYMAYLKYRPRGKCDVHYYTNIFKPIEFDEQDRTRRTFSEANSLALIIPVLKQRGYNLIALPFPSYQDRYNKDKVFKRGDMILTQGYYSDVNGVNYQFFARINYYGVSSNDNKLLDFRKDSANLKNAYQALFKALPACSE